MLCYFYIKDSFTWLTEQSADVAMLAPEQLESPGDLGG